MTKGLFLSLCLGGALSCSASAWANPLINLPHGDMSCAVTVTPRETPPPKPVPPPDPGKPKEPVQPPPPEMTQVSIAQVGKLRRDVVTWTKGAPSETWIFMDMNLVLVQRVVNQTDCIYDVLLQSAQCTLFIPTLLHFDAASVSWITSDARTPDLVQHKGKATIHYQAWVAQPSFDSENPHPSVKKALYQTWLDPKTLVPIAFDDGTYLYELTFSDPPTEPLVPPQRFQQEAAACRRATTVPRHL